MDKWGLLVKSVFMLGMNEETTDWEIVFAEFRCITWFTFFEC